MHVIECETKADWLAARRHGIGASDAPIVLGLSTFKSPLQLYAEKLELVEPDAAESEAALWGTLLEPAIREEFSRRTERRVVYPGPYRILRSRSHPFMSATLDGILPDDARGPGILEVKTGAAWRADDWETEPPVAYQVQVQHAMHVAEVTWGVIVVLLGGQRLVSFELARNDDFLAQLLPQLAEFWRRLEAQEPPPIDGSKASAELLRALYPRETPGARVTLPEAATTWDRDLARAKVQLGKWDTIKRTAEQQLKAAIGDAEIGVLPDGTGSYSWKSSDRAGYTVAPTTLRTLRRQEIKL